MTIQLFRDELVTALNNASTGLNVSKEWKSVMVPPYAVVSLNPESPVTYHQPAKGDVTYHLIVEVGVMKGATIEAAQERLDTYLEPDGADSVYLALINGTYAQVDVIDVVEVSNYGEVVYSGSQYLGAKFKVSAWRSGL